MISLCAARHLRDHRARIVEIAEAMHAAAEGDDGAERWLAAQEVTLLQYMAADTLCAAWQRADGTK